MVNSSKRKLLRSLAAMPLLAAPVPHGADPTRLAHQLAHPRPSLYLPAADLARRLHMSGQHSLTNPVSRLQREFCLGYSHACYLAHQLAEDGVWALAIDQDGARHALFRPQGQA
jgi:hypothetical protein